MHINFNSRTKMPVFWYYWARLRSVYKDTQYLLLVYSVASVLMAVRAVGGAGDASSSHVSYVCF